MSHFMSSMPAAGLIEMPPVSKVTPLPTKATGWSFSPPPFHCMTSSLDSRTLPWPTPSSEPMPRSRMASSPSTSTSTPSSRRASPWAARVSGYMTLGGSETRSRVRNTPSASLSSGLNALRAAAASGPPTVRPESVGFCSAFSLVR